MSLMQRLHVIDVSPRVMNGDVCVSARRTLEMRADNSLGVVHERQRHCLAGRESVLLSRLRNHRAGHDGEGHGVLVRVPVRYSLDLRGLHPECAAGDRNGPGQVHRLISHELDVHSGE